MDKTYDFTALVVLRAPSSEAMETVKNKLVELGFEIRRVSRRGDFVAISCQKERFEQIFKTTVTKIPAQKYPDGRWTPEHFKFAIPVTIPEELQNEVRDVFLPQPVTYQVRQVR